MSLFIRRLVSSRSVLLFTLYCFSFSSTVSAAMISTTQSANLDSIEQFNSAKIKPLVRRAALKQQLIAYGVDSEQVNSRLNSMTDIEIAALSTDISDLPAGGDALAIIAVVFLVLLFTDIAGYTDLFPFVKKTARNSPQHDGEPIDRRKTVNRREPVVIEN